MPHAIPVHTLRFKTYNTKGGLLKLAALASVSAENLCEWFEPSYLETIFLSCQDNLPQHLEGQSEEKLGNLYPILKIAVAATQAKVTDADQTGHIMRLVREYPSPYDLSFNKLRLVSLNPDRPGVYENTIHQLLVSEHGYRFGEMDVARYQERDVIARELLLRGKNIDTIYHLYFPYNHQKGEVLEIQLLDVCAQYDNLYELCNGNMFIYSALRLQRSDLALKFLFSILEAPDDQASLSGKISGLVAVREMEEEKVQWHLKEFSSNLFNRYWEQLSAHAKRKSLSLLIHAERREDVEAAVKDILTLPAEETLPMIYGSPDDLLKHGYAEEARNLILNALTLEHDKLISAFPHGLDNFLEHAVKVDREKTLDLLWSYIKSKVELKRPKVDFLCLLAKFAVTEEEKNRVVSHVQSLSSEEMGDDADGDLCEIYYYLHNQELCRSYYQKMIEKILDGEGSAERQQLLQHFQQAGLDVVSVEEMLALDPFEILPILIKEYS